MLLMRLFIYEHLCASGIFSSMRSEGWAMLSALVQDFQRLDGCEVWTLLDRHCPTSLGHRCHRLPHDDALAPFRDLASKADATLVIAPETDGILARFSRIVHESMGRWFGCTTAAIGLTTDKKALAELWHRAGVPTPELLDAGKFPGFPVVLKPRDGAGPRRLS